MKQKDECKNIRQGEEANQLDGTLTMRIPPKQAKELLSDLEEQRSFMQKKLDCQISDSIIVLIYLLKAKLDS